MSHGRTIGNFVLVLLLSLAAAVPTIALAHGDSEITVRPSALGAGDDLTVLGEGFEGESEVTISLNTAAGSNQIGTVMTDEAGTFRFEGTVPSDLPAGNSEIRATSGEDSAVARITGNSEAPVVEDGALAVTSVEFSAEQEEDGHVVLTATLTDATGQPVADAPVHFAILTTLLDVTGEVTVAEATTGADGVAEAEYEPTFGGAMEAVARFEGVGFYEESEATATFEVTQFEPAYVSESSPLGIVRDWAPLAVGLVVLGIWSTFGFVIYQVFRVARAGGAP